VGGQAPPGVWGKEGEMYSLRIEDPRGGKRGNLGNRGRGHDLMGRSMSKFLKRKKGEEGVLFHK